MLLALRVNIGASVERLFQDLTEVFEGGLDGLRGVFGRDVNVDIGGLAKVLEGREIGRRDVVGELSSILCCTG
jgi:hypothetical protein